MKRIVLAGLAVCSLTAAAIAQERARSPVRLPNPAAPERSPLQQPPVPAPQTRRAAGSADTTTLPPRYGLLGNFGGVRDLLWEHGVLVNMAYEYQAATNLQGGVRGPLLRGAGQFSARAAFDFQRMLGLEGATGSMTITNRQGRDVTVDARLGTQTSVEEIFGRGRIWRLTQFWYDQQFGPWVDLKLGRQHLGEDFGAFPCEFQMLALCASQPGKVAGTYWFNYPVSQWMTRLRIRVPDVAYFQVGAFQVNPDNLVDGFSFDFSRGTGALLVSEVGLLPKIGALGLSGQYKIGAWYETGGGNDVLLNGDGRPRILFGGLPLQRDNRNGLYFVGVQELYRPDPSNSTRSLSAFVRLAYTDEATAIYSAQETAGFVYKGFWKERANDWIGFGFGQTIANPRRVESLILANAFLGAANEIPTQERFLEAFYSIAVTPDIVVRPNIQYINRPSGTTVRPDVVVFGVKSAVNF